MNVRRNRPGTKAKNFNDFEINDDDMDSALAVQQYIQQLILKDPGNHSKILALPRGQDESIWVYEHLRQFAQELSKMVVALSEECTAESCPVMCSQSWEYLCTTHDTQNKCCAIDYTIHTLKQTSDILNDSKLFQSRYIDRYHPFHQYNKILKYINSIIMMMISSNYQTQVIATSTSVFLY